MNSTSTISIIAQSETDRENPLSLEPGRAVLIIEERLANEGGEPLDVMWGHHFETISNRVLAKTDNLA